MRSSKMRIPLRYLILEIPSTKGEGKQAKNPWKRNEDNTNHNLWRHQCKYSSRGNGRGIRQILESFPTSTRTYRTRATICSVIKRRHFDKDILRYLRGNLASRIHRSTDFTEERLFFRLLWCIFLVYERYYLSWSGPLDSFFMRKCFCSSTATVFQQLHFWDCFLLKVDIVEDDLSSSFVLLLFFFWTIRRK